MGAGEQIMVQDVRDQMARDDATRALMLIEGHERVCAERHSHVLEGLHDVRGGVEGLYRRFWFAALSCISLLLTICGSLFFLVAKQIVR